MIWEKNVYIYFGSLWVTLLYSRIWYHSINRLYFNKKLKSRVNFILVYMDNWSRSGSFMKDYPFSPKLKHHFRHILNWNNLLLDSLAALFCLFIQTCGEYLSSESPSHLGEKPHFWFLPPSHEPTPYKRNCKCQLEAFSASPAARV